MPVITVEEAQAKLPQLIGQLAKGEQIGVTEGGQVVARIVGERATRQFRPGPGLAKGMLTIISDDDEHLREFAEYMP